MAAETRVLTIPTTTGFHVMLEVGQLERLRSVTDSHGRAG